MLNYGQRATAQIRNGIAASPTTNEMTSTGTTPWGHTADPLAHASPDWPSTADQPRICSRIAAPASTPSTRTNATCQALNRPGRVATFGVVAVGCTGGS